MIYIINPHKNKDKINEIITPLKQEFQNSEKYINFYISDLSEIINCESPLLYLKNTSIQVYNTIRVKKVWENQGEYFGKLYEPYLTIKNEYKNEGINNLHLGFKIVEREGVLYSFSSWTVLIFFNIKIERYPMETY
jgi:methyltransferase-like protein